MQIKIRVIPKAKQNKIVKEKDRYKIWVTTAPVDNKANKAVIKILADFLEIKKAQVEIISGFKSRDKVVEIKERN